MSRCKKSDKTKFKTEKTAKMRIRKIAKKSPKQFRCYKCPYCSGWHLSSIKVDFRKIR